MSVDTEVIRTRYFTKYMPEELNEEILDKATIIVFEEIEIERPEICEINHGKIRISDIEQGIVEWSESSGQYVRLYRFTRNLIGQLKEVLVEKFK